MIARVLLFTLTTVMSFAPGIVAPSLTQRLGCVTKLQGTVRMQYGYNQQGGYDQQGGYAQQGYNQQGGSQVLLHGTQGVTGHDNHIYGRDKSNYMYLPYVVRVGDEHVLGRMNMMFPSSFVSRVQCIVQVGPDGTPYLYSCGKPATGFRQSPDAPWEALQKGKSTFLASGGQISLDYQNPDGAIFTCQIDGQCGAYGQQIQQPLPYPWEQQVDPSSGQTYYYNPQTGQSQWEAPL